MDVNDYQKQTARTANMTLAEDPTINDKMIKMVLGLGCAGEAGEVADLIKKNIGHGHEIDLDKLTKELGDVTWYISEIATKYGIKLSTVLEKNLDKLNKRYPEGFSEEASRNRKE